MLLVDEDVGHRALVSHLLERILNGSAVLCRKGESVSRDYKYDAERIARSIGRMARRHTDLVQLNGEVLGAFLGQESLGGLAVGAVGLAEDGCISCK